MPIPPLEPIPTGGAAVALLAFIWRAFLWFTRAAKERKDAEPKPESRLNDDIYRNGERWNFRRTLIELLNLTDNHDARIAKLESDSRDGDRAHGDLDDRLADLERRFRSFRNNKE